RGDCELRVNEPLEILGIVYSILLREDADCVKVSARSVNDFPVSTICEELFGGGGHIQAAGAEFKGTLKECHDLIVEHLRDYDRFLPSRQDKIDFFEIDL
ncbi:MAG: bifunctional oligoribonuclease/PAP phosphatase NrnA, partial [Muribaculaceae bacterium]|nr:bifunctional oligoribonuclease/PAP phosphatase NrnA [Muribaculaceae bacterium]